MILLLSRQDDRSTRDVSVWLSSMNKKFIRFNADDKANRIISCNVTNECFHIELNGKEYKIRIKDIKSVWNRRSGFCKDTLVKNNESINIFHTEEISVKKHLSNEIIQVFDFLYYLLESNKNIQHIGSQQYNVVNKLKVLKIAKKCGLNIPNSYISTKRDDLKKIVNDRKIVTKAIGNGIYAFTNEYGYYSYTERLSKRFINGLPESFFPSLIQEEIEKQYDLRIFYLEGIFYAMAIFSQESSQTVTDNRKGYASKYIPRQVPYQLPKEIEKHLKLMMDKLKLNTGSIDMVVSRKNEFFFLEVNPVGQFGMISKPCNYYLERKIAEIL